MESEVNSCDEKILRRVMFTLSSLQNAAKTLKIEIFSVNAWAMVAREVKLESIETNFASLCNYRPRPPFHFLC